MKVRQMTDGCDVAQALLVREVELRRRREGTDYLKLLLGDCSGQVPAVIRENVAHASGICRPGEVVFVAGRYGLHARYGPQLEVHRVRSATEGEYDPSELHGGPARAPGQMEADLRALLATVHNPHLRRLLSVIFGEGSVTWASYRDAPAAKRFHQAYRHGLLEHCLTVAQAVSAISATFPGIDRDVAVTGALLHDIGKLEAYTADPTTAIDLTDDGRLQGEIPLGYYRVRRRIEELEGFPPQLARAVLHIILSHHGSLAHGSPVVPCTREATLVHMIDNLGGRLGSFDRLEKELPQGQEWSGFDRAIGAGAWFGLQLADAAQPGEQQQLAA